MSNKQKDSKWQKLKKEFYGTKTCVQSEYGTIDFDPDSMGDVVGGDKLTYDEYLDILMRSGKNVRGWFEMCYFETALEFAGQVEKINKDNICFKRIYVCGMFMDGECFDGKEDHVWMSKEGFRDCQVGDCFSFFAEVYRYLKTSNGNDVETAKEELFLKTYNDLFHDHNGIKLQTKTLGSIVGIPLGRGARLKETEIPDYERFLPKKEFINEDNRFSPAGVEWLYLAVDDGNTRSECAKKECRMKAGERFGFCDFQLLDNVLGQKIVDLTIADALSYADINNELEKYGQKQYKRSLKIAKATGLNVPIDKSAFNEAMTKWGVFTYSKLLSQAYFGYSIRSYRS